MAKKEESDEEVQVTFPFLLYIRIENSSLKEMMELCDGFDVFEMVPENEDKKRDYGEKNAHRTMIVDVIEVAKDEIVIKITLQKSLTYSEIYDQLMKLVDFVKMRTQREIFMHISRILWEKPMFGVPSEIRHNNMKEIDHFRIE